MKALKSIVGWLDTWNEYPSHIVTVGLVAVVLGALAIAFAIAAT